MRQKTSRLGRTTEQKTKKQIIYLIIAIVVLLIGLIQFGPVAINAVGEAVSSFRKPQSQQNINVGSVLEIPFVTDIPNATTSAKIIILGSSPYSDATVELYVNDAKQDALPLTEEQDFTFDNVSLKEGENSIKLRVKKGSDVSDFTRDYIVNYSKSEPKLEVSTPNDGQEFNKGDQSINVSGKTNPDNSVTVNSFRAIVDGDGNFSYYLKLNDGDNTVKIEATTPAGSTLLKEVKVKYNP